MNIIELIRSRESVRNFDPERPVSQDVLMQIAEAGRLAPSAANLQPWRFIFVSSCDKLQAVKGTYFRAWFADAPHVLIVVGDKDTAWKRQDGYNSIETDLTIAMDHMILAADCMGLATCWVGNFDYEQLRTILGLASTEVVFALTPLGYPKAGFEKKRLKNRRPIDEVVQFI
jgi:nitroreductase